MQTRSLRFAVIVFVGFLCSVGRLSAASADSLIVRAGNIETSTTADEPRVCSDVRVRFAGRDAARTEELLTGSGPSGPRSLDLPSHAGAFIRGADRRDWSIRACKAADSAATLATVRVSFDRGELRAEGPEADTWLVYYLIEGPSSEVSTWLHRIEADRAVVSGPVSIDAARSE